MQAQPVTTGRTFGVTFDDGDDFFPSLDKFCRENDIRQGYIPMFLAGFAEAEIVGTCDKVDDPKAPIWSPVHLTNVDAVGCGTLAYDVETNQVLPHVHVSVGLKAHAAVGYTSHLLNCRVQFLVEMLVVEVKAPSMSRPRNQALYDIPILTFGANG